jgi:hypothetical protein
VRHNRFLHHERNQSMRGFILLSVVLVTAGCSQMAPSSVYRAYAPFSQAGYRDKQIGEGEWEITYETDITDRDDYAERYARYRAAELAHAAGYPFFQIVKEGGSRSTGLGVENTIVEITVRGARSRSEQLMCESKSIYSPTPTRSPCEMHPTDTALLRFVPLKRRGQPAAAAPDSIPG